MGMAEKENIALFETHSDAEGNNIVPNIIDDEKLNKISLIIKNADINIYGGSETNYIELINFGVNSYSYAITNNILTIDETIGILSLINFSETTIGFNGLRHYLNWNLNNSKPSSVNIYLSDKYDIKQLEITLNSGNINIYNMQNRISYLLNIKKGDIIYKNTNTRDAVNITLGEGSVEFDASSVLNLMAEIDKGDFTFASEEYDYQSYSIILENGIVYLEGEDKGYSFSASTPTATSAVSVRIKSGNVYIKDINN